MRYFSFSACALLTLVATGCVTSGVGTLNVGVVTPSGGPVANVALKVTSVTGSTAETAKSGADGRATFALPKGSYDVDGVLTGFKSCGPERTHVRSAGAKVLTLVFRVCAFVDGFVVFDCPQPPCRDPAPYSELDCGPCPGKPEIPSIYDYSCPSCPNGLKHQR